MHTLFNPIKLGPVEIQNRFIHSATYEGMALANGEVTDGLVKRYRNLVKEEVGLIIPGYMYTQGNAAKMIKPEIGTVPLSVVVGLRSLEHMSDVIDKGSADMISMSRPFIREPFIVKKVKEGKTDTVSCLSCNKCLAAAANSMPVRCYNKG